MIYDILFKCLNYSYQTFKSSRGKYSYIRYLTFIALCIDWDIHYICIYCLFLDNDWKCRCSEKGGQFNSIGQFLIVHVMLMMFAAERQLQKVSSNPASAVAIYKTETDQPVDRRHFFAVSEPFSATSNQSLLELQKSGIQRPLQLQKNRGIS